MPDAKAASGLVVLRARPQRQDLRLAVRVQIGVLDRPNRHEPDCEGLAHGPAGRRIQSEQARLIEHGHGGRPGAAYQRGCSIAAVWVDAGEVLVDRVGPDPSSCSPRDGRDDAPGERIAV